MLSPRGKELAREWYTGAVKGVRQFDIPTRGTGLNVTDAAWALVQSGHAGGGTINTVAGEVHAALPRLHSSVRRNPRGPASPAGAHPMGPPSTRSWIR
jgi:hypothetical protein